MSLRVMRVQALYSSSANDVSSVAVLPCENRENTNLFIEWCDKLCMSGV